MEIRKSIIDKKELMQSKLFQIGGEEFKERLLALCEAEGAVMWAIKKFIFSFETADISNIQQVKISNKNVIQFSYLLSDNIDGLRLANCLMVDYINLNKFSIIRSVISIEPDIINRMGVCEELKFNDSTKLCTYKNNKTFSGSVKYSLTNETNEEPGTKI